MLLSKCCGAKIKDVGVDNYFQCIECKQLCRVDFVHKGKVKAKWILEWFLKQGKKRGIFVGNSLPQIDINAVIIDGWFDLEALARHLNKKLAQNV